MKKIISILSVTLFALLVGINVQANPLCNSKAIFGFGATGQTVSALQNYLRSLGYFSSAATGFYGVQTVAAVKSFQSANKISTTGYYGVQTLAAVQSKLCQPVSSAQTSQTISSVATNPVVQSPAVLTNTITENVSVVPVVTTPVSNTSIKSGTFNLKMKHDGRNRSYIVYVPQNYKTNGSALINLHGGAGNAKQQCEDSVAFQTADELGFIVVCPDGTARGISKFYTWNDGSLPVYATENKVDDVGFIGKIIDELVSKYQVSSNRIYVAGYSNGGMLAYRLACELSNKISGIGVVAGSMGNNFNNCNPIRNIPIIVFHGLYDENIPFAGGYGTKSAVSYSHPSLTDSVLFWVRKNGLNQNANNIVSRGQAYSYIYGNSNQTQIKVWVLFDGGHTWPGGKSSLGESRLGKINTDVSATREIMQFLDRSVVLSIF